jgi:signal transduction histidine kinase
MFLNRLSVVVRSLRFRLLLWNAGAVMVTGIVILLAVRQGVRYTLLFDLDQVLREDLKEIDLHFVAGEPYDWNALQDEMDRKARGHDFHRWFVRFYDREGQKVWSSVNAPDDRTVIREERRPGPFSINSYRVAYQPLPPNVLQATSVMVGCSERYLARDLELIDRLVLIVFSVLLLASPAVGIFLTSRTIQPLAEMIRTTARLRPGELKARVPIRGTGDELDILAGKVNDLLDRIADYLQQEHDFVANAAHELRTPLAAIRSSVEVALSTDRSQEDYRELLGLVIDQCLSLQALVNQLLLLAETDARRLVAADESVRFDQLVRQAVEMFEGVAEERQVAITIERLDEVDLPGHRNHLRQVLNNLLDNAIKFTAVRRPDAGEAAPGESATGEDWIPGKVTIWLIRSASGNSAELAISDNGVGIDPEDLPRIFERFYRADKSRSRDVGARGSGLGLSICRAIVEAHHGSIEVSSVPNVGTTFTVRLPLTGREPVGDTLESRKSPAHPSAD